MERTGRLDRGDGVELAWAHLPAQGAGRGPTVVFLPGFKSDMAGVKATHLRDLCAGRGQSMLRLDYSGHGESGGSFDAGSIGRWAEDAQTVIDAIAPGPVLLVGSSMGGWIALLLGRAMGARLTGLVGIAAAPDFTESLIWAGLTGAQRETMAVQGHIDIPSDYGEPYRITRHLIEDGRRQLLLHAAVPITCPVRLLQGQRDDDVPWHTAQIIAEKLDSTDVQVVLIKDGDHRLSRPADLALLGRTVVALLGEDAG